MANKNGREKDPKSVRSKVRALAVGERRKFRKSNAWYVRFNISNFGKEFGMKFRTHMNEGGTEIEVLRIE